MPFHDDLEALAARHETLASQAATAIRERDDAKVLLDDARARAKLPVLDHLRVASPCRADWSKMAGDERVRACGECKRDVYNLSQMTREQAEALIVERNGRLCVRYFQRADGTVLLADCTIGRRRQRRLAIAAGGIAGALAGAAVYGATRPAAPERDVPREPVHVEDTTMMMGEMELGPPTELPTLQELCAADVDELRAYATCNVPEDERAAVRLQIVELETFVARWSVEYSLHHVTDPHPRSFADLCEEQRAWVAQLRATEPGCKK